MSAPTVESYWWKTAWRDARFGRSEQRQQDRAGVHAPLGEPVADRGGRARRRRTTAVGRRGRDALVDDGIARQRAAGIRASSRAPAAGPPVGVEAAFDDRDVAVGRHPPDDRDGQAPALAHLADGRPALGADGGAHPLLRLRDHDLERLEARLASRDGIQVDDDPRPGPIGGLGGRARDPAGAEVLEALDEAALDELQARLDEQLLRERVADLDGRPLGRVVVGERGAGQDRRAADPVAPGRRSVQHDEVAGAGRGGEGQQRAPRAGRWP